MLPHLQLKASIASSEATARTTQSAETGAARKVPLEEGMPLDFADHVLSTVAHMLVDVVYVVEHPLRNR